MLQFDALQTLQRFLTRRYTGIDNPLIELDCLAPVASFFLNFCYVEGRAREPQRITVPTLLALRQKRVDHRQVALQRLGRLVLFFQTAANLEFGLPFEIDIGGGIVEHLTIIVQGVGIA